MLATKRPMVILDTSAMNALYDDAEGASKLNKLRHAYFPLLTFSVLDELVATTDPYRNTQLFELALKIQSAGNCILPFNYLLKNHVHGFLAGTDFDWKRVNCLGNQLKERIVENRHELSKELTDQQREQNMQQEREYKEELKRKRNIVQEDPEWRARFTSFEDFSAFALGVAGPYWKVAIQLIELAVELERAESLTGDDPLGSLQATKSSENLSLDDVVKFARQCPPFESSLYGIVSSAYSRIHDPLLNRRERGKAPGRVDTFMACYLPYCRFFVTNDTGQFDCYTRVVAKLGLETEVCRYEEFWTSLPY